MKLSCLNDVQRIRILGFRFFILKLKRLRTIKSYADEICIFKETIADLKPHN